MYSALSERSEKPLLPSKFTHTSNFSWLFGGLNIKNNSNSTNIPKESKRRTSMYEFTYQPCVCLCVQEDQGC